MEYRRLGRSDLHVSAVGFGTAQLRLVPEQQAIDTLLTSFDLGVNLVHTGIDYGAAEAYVAKAIALTDRKIIVAYHGADTPSEGQGRVRAFEQQFDAACMQFGTDRLDMFGIACIDDREAFGENVWGRHGMVEFLQRRKREGTLGATFCSTHGAPKYVARLVTSGAFDAVMMAYNVLGYHLLSCYPTPGRHFESIDCNKHEIFPLCRQHGVGLMIMKPFAGGLLCDSQAFPPRLSSTRAASQSQARELLRSILLNPEVSCVVPGTNSIEEAEENARSGEGPIAVADDERQDVDSLVSEVRQSVCSRCGKCEPLCSQNLSISWLFRAGLINLQPSARHEVLEQVDYFRLNASLEAPCASCTNRTCICPDGIDIPASLTAMHQQMVDLMAQGLIPGPKPGEPSVRVPRAESMTAAADTVLPMANVSAYETAADTPLPIANLFADDTTAADTLPRITNVSAQETGAAERDTLRQELNAARNELLVASDRLRALEHVVGSIQRSLGYRILRTLGRWQGVDATLKALSIAHEANASEPAECEHANEPGVVMSEQSREPETTQQEQVRETTLNQATRPELGPEAAVPDAASGAAPGTAPGTAVSDDAVPHDAVLNDAVPDVAPLHDWNLNPVVHPLEAAHGYAGHLVNLQGRDFVDFSAAWGANLLGYGYPRVADAIATQARRYAGVGMTCPELREIEQLLSETIPGAELIRFGKNGSDSTMGAIRVARAISGRDLVLHRGYHGFHDWWMASTDCQGIPASLRTLIKPLSAFTPEAVEEAFGQHEGQIACIIFDPMIPPTPKADAVRAIVEIAHRHGALVIIDEVVSGFRVAPGGMQEIWGLKADLACHGKGIANGMPLSVLSGKAEYMRRLEDVRYGMTFEAEAVSLVAALATVKEVIEKNVCGALAEKGQRLVDAYGQLAAQYGVSTRLGGPFARPHLEFETQADIPERRLRWLCLQELAHAGVLTVGVFNLCYMHDDKDLDLTIAAFERAMRALRQALEQGSVAGLLDERIHRAILLAERVQ